MRAPANQSGKARAISQVRGSWRRAAAILLSFFLSGALAQLRAEIHPPVGPYINLTEDDFAGTHTFYQSDRLVGTHYFYWYDVFSGAHIVDNDGTDALTTHPPTLTGFSYKSKAWHKRQLTDIMEAGIDFLLPVYWGAPSERTASSFGNHWSYAGLGPLVQAREELLAEGKNPPWIGMFYDTSTLQFNSWNQQIDLTTAYGKDWFYESIRDFFSLIPPKHWMMIDGRPVVFLYSSSFASRHDQGVIDFLRQAFARDFGGRVPYVVREISWNVQSENVYAWGGALGLKKPGVASLGPGYDHSAVPGRDPLVVDREEGEFYSRNWNRFLQNPSSMVVVETWNEFHEGTDVAESREYGRHYIELTRRYVDMFKSGQMPPPVVGPHTGARTVHVQLGNPNSDDGLKQIESADGLTQPVEIAGSWARQSVSGEHLGRYIYFRVDDSFKWTNSMRVVVAVEYYDGGTGSFGLEFDGSDLSAPFGGAYTRSPMTVRLTGLAQWRTAIFEITGARFLNSQNAGSDFRLTVSAEPFYVRRVAVIRPDVIKLESVRAEAAGELSMELRGDRGRTYWIQSSPDLSDWHDVKSITLSGWIGSVRVPLEAGPRGFYRARTID